MVTLVRVAELFPALWVVLLYRLCHFFDARCRPKFLGKILLTLTYIPFRILGVMLGVEINFRSHIGAGLLINHFGGVHIGPVIMGENCNIAHAVTIGRSSRVHDATVDNQTQFIDTPTLGDRVWLGPGAVISGGIALGSDSVVAANSFVNRDVPPRGIAMGVPAKTVSYKGSFQQVLYRGMDQDPGRLAVLAELRTMAPAQSSAE
jgi:serine O-acetyltransferase